MTPALDETHDPHRRSWVEGADGHPDFPVQNLPLGVFSPAEGARRIGCAIGGHVLDLKALATTELLPQAVAQALQAETLNALLALPGRARAGLRRRLSALLSGEDERGRVEPLLHPAPDCELHVPAAIGDYTDFYVGIHHATNIGALFRPDNPILPNYKHVPIGYHGRASSVRASGASVVRPSGQRKQPGAEAPDFGPSRRLDYELELGVWIGGANALGQPVPIAEAGERIAGLCLLNDWSARDLQAWEYQPLGPFLAKNFQTTVSPWIVTADALAPFRRPQPLRPAGDPQPLPYLWDEADQTAGSFALELTVNLTTARMREAGADPRRLSRGTVGPSMYWTVAQLVTHHASNGCNLQPGDLLGTGTLSTAEPAGYGSLMELSVGGGSPLTLPSGETRTFLEDGDEIAFSARASAPGRVSIGFGECRAIVLPAPSP